MGLKMKIKAAVHQSSMGTRHWLKHMKGNHRRKNVMVVIFLGISERH